MSEVKTNSIEDMIKITTGYVREGILFDVTNNNGTWIIKLTGGY
ncbi:unnamed protein product [marine sediment metagenome]|uniref:Uncharacterized protein n=1 Tax=marine sediment metagenome TaxID=412755 RepID=X0U2M2_9ZZZZ